MGVDFEAFKEDVSWFVKPTSTVLFKDGIVTLSEEFKKTFPKLTSLIESARVTFVEVDRVDYLLFAWTDKNDRPCGWLNKWEGEESRFKRFIPEHKLLVENIGGIQESFNRPEDSYCSNQNFIFTGSESGIGIGYYDDYYHMKCEDNAIEPIKYSHLISFAEEANGALTLYEPDTKKVLLLSHDHCFENVDFVEGQPKYTFHTFKGVETFVDYVEELAEQWIKYVRNGQV